MNLRDFQLWMNVHGAGLDPDGKAGPKTRSAVFAIFANRNAPAATRQDLSRTAEALGVSVKQLEAVAAVESSGGGFLPSGLPKALYERHYFWRRMRVRIPLLSDPTPGGYTLDADRDGLNDSWEKIADAAMRNPVAAFESASFGRFQIMGAWAAKLGYGNSIEFAYALSRSEAAHFDALGRFVRVNGLIPAMRAISTDPDSCRAFAKGYNGRRYERLGYHLKLARAMR